MKDLSKQASKQAREEVRLLFKPIFFLYTSCKGGYNLGGGLYG